MGTPAVLGRRVPRSVLGLARLTTTRGHEMNSSPLAHHFESLEKQGHAHRLGMWLFLASEILLFTALFAAYGVYRFLYPDAFALSSRAIETS
jgi:heme/copper-type cytochrome/quinol oxidase subunit 3